MAVNVVSGERRTDIRKDVYDPGYDPSLDISPRMNWSAIFSGAFAILGLAGFFHLLGNGIGFSAANFVKGGVGPGTRVITFIYYVVTMCASFYVGGAISARMAAHRSRMSSLLHSMVAWAMAGVVGLAFGVATNLTINRTIYGAGMNTLNWLLIAIAGLGFASAMGGALSQKLLSKGETEKERYESAA